MRLKSVKLTQFRGYRTTTVMAQPKVVLGCLRALQPLLSSCIG